MSHPATFGSMIENQLLTFVYRTTEQPMLFRELLNMNKRYDDGLGMEGKIPGAKLRIGRTVLVFLIIWNLIVLPGSLIFHHELAKIDCHLLLILAIVFTGMFFGMFAMFKEWLIDKMTQRRIREGWINHFPHFIFDKHHREVSDLYNQALEQEIPGKELYLFILDQMIRPENQSTSE